MARWYKPMMYAKLYASSHARIRRRWPVRGRLYLWLNSLGVLS